MAELVLSAVLPVLFDKLASAAVKNIARSNEIHSDLKKWERSLSQIRALLNDASQKEVTDEAVKQWLNSLRHLAYDIDDMLDDMATEAMQREFTNESQPITNKVKKLIPACCTNFSLSTRMSSKLNNITTKLQELVDEKNNLGLSVKEGHSKNKNRSEETSLVNPKSIVGREADKKELLEQLLSDEPSNQNFGIVPIVGMGGMGKTTLAKLLYDDQLVKDRFELMAWVCVSDEFDSFNISKVIFQCVGGETKEEFADLNLLQVALRDRLMGKLFLLVLDDVWSDKLKDWETLAGPFFAGARGSKIIITTRKKELVRKLGHDHPYELKKLSPEDALELFAQHAGINDFDSYPMLRPHGEGIVQKCDGLPLALKALGSILRTKEDEEEWKQLLANEIWSLQDVDGILPPLRLSYQDLSACLKQLFAYCCLFPKDYVFQKDDLILLWTAEGFLHQSTKNKSMKRLGEEYFQELLSRSFFQHVPDADTMFVMHDLMNDLATSVAGEFFVRLDDKEKDVRKEALEKYRHMSFVCEEYIAYDKFHAFKRAHSLRTLLAAPVVSTDRWDLFYFSNKILVDLLPELPLLRVLCLSQLEIDEVPECVGNLKHLRYLNLSETRITHLPENVCNLCNLETLIVSGCDRLKRLPNNFLKLKNLRHFDIRDTLLWNITPSRLRELKGLQILSNVIVGENDDFPISGLKNIKNVRGKIDIRGLEKVKSARGVQEANLSQKRVSELKVSWTDVFNDSRNGTLEMEVLGALKPDSDNLKDLEIKSYGGDVFPNWIGDPSFLGLGSVSICYCKKCMFLPPLGQLPSLKKLCISGMNEVKDVGSELLGIGPAFPSLKILEFRDMEGWEVWSTSVGIVGAVFPCLQQLTLRNCPNLVKVSLEALPSLRSLEIGGCGDGVLTSLIRVASSVTKLSISGVSDKVWTGVMDYLGAVEEITIFKCNEIRYLWESEVEASRVLVNLRKLEVIECNEIRYLWESGVEASRVLVNLRELKVSDCSESVSLGEKEEDGCNHLTSLTTLELSMCKNLQHFSCPNNIESLDIRGCTSITSVSFPPTGGFQKLKSLKIEKCNEVLEKELENMLINTNMPMLEVVRIDSLLDLKSVGSLTCFIHLTELSIVNCSSIKSFPGTALPNLASLKKLIILNCKSMDVASFGLWPPKLDRLYIGALKKPISQLGPQQFPTSLVDLNLYGGSAEEDDVSSGVQLSHMLPSSLTYLELYGFYKLKSVSKGLEHLTSLQHLFINDCPKMKDLPEKLLPSLLELYIWNCPNKLKEKISRRGSYWPLISYIPDVMISK